MYCKSQDYDTLIISLSNIKYCKKFSYGSEHSNFAGVTKPCRVAGGRVQGTVWLDEMIVKYLRKNIYPFFKKQKSLCSGV